MGNGFKVDNEIRPVPGYYDDDDFVSEEGGFRNEWVPNYWYNWPVHKRSPPKVTQVCCKNACSIKTLLSYCPRIKM